MTKKRKPGRVCSIIGLALLLMMAVWYGGSTLLYWLQGTYWPAASSNVWIFWLINDVPLYFLGMPVFLLVLRFVPNGPDVPRPKMPVGLPKYLLVLLFCFSASHLLNLVSSLIMAFFAWVLPAGGAGDMARAVDITAAGPLPSILFGAVVPALGEEFIFRWCLHRKLRGAADRTYVFMSGLCFALFHGNISQMLYAFVLGVVFAWLYATTRNIWLPVSLHFIFNMVGLVLMPMLEYGSVAMGLVGLLVLCLLPVSVVLFCLFRKPVLATLAPPTEAGWPHRMPKWLPRFAWRQDQKWNITSYARWLQGKKPPPYPYIAPLFATLPEGPEAPGAAEMAGRQGDPMAPEGQPDTPQAAGMATAPQAGAAMQQGPALAAPPAPAPPAVPAQPPYPPPQPAGPVFITYQQRRAAAQVPPPLPPGTAPPPPAPRARRRGALGVCVANVGMVLYLLLTLAITALNVYQSI